MRETGGAASRQLSGLKSEDTMILDVFFGNLGKSGRAEQSELFASIIERMEEALESARNSYLEGAKLFTALGTLAGIGICVLII